RVQERLPFRRKTMTRTEEPEARVGLVGDVVLFRCLPQRLAALARGVTKVDDHVGDGREIELVRVAGKLDEPVAHRSGAFEGQIPFVAEVQLEESAVVLARAGRDRLDGADLVAEA